MKAMQFKKQTKLVHVADSFVTYAKNFMHAMKPYVVQCAGFFFTLVATTVSQGMFKRDHEMQCTPETRVWHIRGSRNCCFLCW